MGQCLKKARETKTAATEQVKALWSATGTSYQQLRSKGVKAWVIENVKTAAEAASSAVQTVRTAASKQYVRAISAVSTNLKYGKDAARSRASAFLAAAKTAYADTMKTSVKAVETAKVKALEL